MFLLPTSLLEGGVYARKPLTCHCEHLVRGGHQVRAGLVKESERSKVSAQLLRTNGSVSRRVQLQKGEHMLCSVLTYRD